jgi:hypothetical protein
MREGKGESTRRKTTSINTLKILGGCFGHYPDLVRQRGKLQVLKPQQ